jgi:hypothetical protein
MIAVLEFRTVEGATLGRVRLGESVDADPAVESFVDGYDDPADVLDRYGDWSNGYVSCRRVDGEDA